MNTIQYNNTYAEMELADIQHKYAYHDLLWTRLRQFYDNAFAPHEIPVVVEIGALRGNFSENFLRRFPTTRYFAVDPWPDTATLLQWMKRVEQWLWKSCFPLRGSSQSWHRAFPYLINVLYIDGDHSPKGIRRDLKFWAPLVGPGGLILGHDYNRGQIQQAVSHAFPLHESFVFGPMRKDTKKGPVLGFWIET